jgi:hypothetical protein
MTSKSLKIILVIVFILIVAGLAYWQFFMRGNTGDTAATPSTQQNGFVPFGRTTTPSSTGTSTTPRTTGNNGQTVPGTQLKIPTLRLLSSTPVSGYGASTTGTVKTPVASSTTVVRWMDRGRGNIYEALGNSPTITTVSNTVIPKMYETGWNKNLTAIVAFGISDKNNVGGVWAELRPRVMPKVSSTTPVITDSSLSPHELRGKNLPENIVAYAVSPKKDRVFLLINEKGAGVGYIFKFDGSSPVQIFSTPVTQVNAEWPTDATIALTTKGAADERGFLYFVDAKTGVWKKILGPLPGLSAKVSTDAKKVIVSVTGSSNNFLTSIYDVTKRAGTDAVIRTLADKCVWGNFYKDLVYCAAPADQIPGVYPDDWYKGNVSFTDKIWQVNATTGEVHLISSIVDTSDRVIDAFNLSLDDRDNFLIFMNKNDLSLWSLDLVSKN